MTLSDWAVSVLKTSNAAEKALRAHEMAAAWRFGEIVEIGHTRPPSQPARPAKPNLADAKDMPRRGFGAVEGRAAFLHAIAHIELNAIDLACDLIARFADQSWPRVFYDDWVTVVDDEARHFTWLTVRLDQLGKAYGDYAAHNGLWEAARVSADDPLARLAVVPMVLEARGLDTTPNAVHKFRSAGDTESADILARIGKEEEPHVAAGVRWFEYICAERNIDPVTTFHKLIRERLKITFKPPFAVAAREASGMTEAYYLPLVPQP